MTSYNVIGTPFLATNYAALTKFCKELARKQKPVAIEFANTQIVAMRRHEPWFRELTSEFDYFIPDGMPIVWHLNRQGAGLRDRVYGPTFMRQFLSTVSDGFTHYFLGGSAECGAKLRERFQSINSAVRYAGSFHGRCDLDGTSNSDEQLIDEINSLSPDFIWVGLGTPKQQAWVKLHKHRLRRGVVLTVGFAFDVNAGMKPDAPVWMQRAALTWLFRFFSEPRRLAGRYIRYNSLFLYYWLRSSLRKHNEQ